METKICQKCGEEKGFFHLEKCLKTQTRTLIARFNEYVHPEREFPKLMEDGLDQVTIRTISQIMDKIDQLSEADPERKDSESEVRIMTSIKNIDILFFSCEKPEFPENGDELMRKMFGDDVSMFDGITELGKNLLIRLFLQENSKDPAKLKEINHDLNILVKELLSYQQMLKMLQEVDELIGF